MTEKLFYQDGYMREFDARVISCEQAGEEYQVVLDRTAFFPEGEDSTQTREGLAGRKSWMYRRKTVSSIIR